MRDSRFIATHRGGTLPPQIHHLLAQWAADCAGHVLPLFEHERSEDSRPLQAIQAARAWAAGEIRVGQARQAAFTALACARACDSGSAKAAALAAMHAAATAHMADHALAGAMYAELAVKCAALPNTRDSAAAKERVWQIAQLPDDIYDLVVSVIDLRRLG